MMTVVSLMESKPQAGYDNSRLNALRHGMLSRHVVLFWEDGTEYRSLVDALAVEHKPEGPTEEHLVEELAGLVWRKRRLRMAEASVIRERLRHEVSGYGGSGDVARAALLALTGTIDNKANAARAIAGSPSETASQLRSAERDRARTLKAWRLLSAGGDDAYERALSALRDDTRDYWRQCLAQGSDDGERCEPNAAALKAWIDRHWTRWFEDPIAELEHRHIIRDHAFGAAYAAPGLQVTARYEVHLDRKLERTLAMLLRLKELRPAAIPG